MEPPGRFERDLLRFAAFTGLAGQATSLGALVGARFLAGLGLAAMVPFDQPPVTEYAPARIGSQCRQ